jgi:hypothetical protein
MAGKGRPKTGGRQKGTPNKLTADVKAMVLDALDQAGGVAYLLTQAQSNPNAFLTLVGKVLPMTVAGDPENPLGVVTRIELVSMRDGRTD